MNNYIKKYWIHFNIIFIAAALTFQVIKTYNSHSFSTLHFNITGAVLLAAGISAISYIFIIRKKSNIVLSLILLATGYTLLCFGYNIQKDPELMWEGSDVAWYNFGAGEEVSKYGACYVVSTWNTRANPFDTIDDTDVFPPEVKEMFRKDVYKDYMKWFIGDRWNSKSLNLDKNNNRPYMHPPLTPVVIGLWLDVFPFGRYSAQTLMVLLNLLVFSLIFKKYYREGTNAFYVLFFGIVTTPVAILFINPSAEQLAMLLTALSVILLLHKDLKGSFYLPLLSGLLMGLTFYTKFIVVFYAVFQVIALLINYRKITLKPLLGYLLGFVLVFLAFTFSGYYFWLTVLTGKVVTDLYINSNPPVTIFQIILKLYYFGLPLIVLTVYMFYMIFREFKFIKDKIILIPLILGVVIYMGLTWKVGTFNRYLFVFVPALFPFLYSVIKGIEFSKKDVLIVPAVSILLLGLILYL
jgi:hypothetical protein